MADRDTDQPAERPGRIRRLRNRLPAATVRVPLPAGMDMVVSGPQGADVALPTSLANVLLSYLAAANTTTLYLEQKVALLARTLPGDNQENARRLRPLSKLAALPQQAAARILLPPLQSHLPNPAELAAMPVRFGRNQLNRARNRVVGWIRSAPQPEEEQEAPRRAQLLVAHARTPVLLMISSSLYSVSLVAYSVHSVTDRMRLIVWRRI